MANITHPGSFIDIHKLHATDISQYMSTAKSAEHNSGFWPLILSIIPTNIFKSMSDGDMMPDRKSTRLNSSHVSISYAAFLLKKKKQVQHDDADAKDDN